MTSIRTLAALLLCALMAFAAPAFAQEDPFFSIDGLNEGLADLPEDIDRRTPRATMRAFILATEAEDWERAAHLLDLSELPVADQARDGPILAQQLASVMDRKAVLDWSALIERPDALQVLGGRTQVQAGEPRRSLLLRELNLDPVPAALRLERVKPGEDADPQWVFSRETVDALPDLYREYGPAPWEARMPEWVRGDAFWGLMWWEVLALPLLALAAFVLGGLVLRAVDASSRISDRPIVQAAVRAVRWPAAVAAVTAFVGWIAGNVFVFSGQIDTWLSPLLAIGYVTAVLMLVINVSEAVLDGMISPDEDVDLTDAEREEARSTATKLNAAKRILTIVVFLIGAGVVLSTADVFRGLGLSLLASAGALTIVLGFAARDVLANVMASLQIAMNQSARIGDRVKWKDELCYVERIHLTYVLLRDWDNTRVIVPVREFISETFINWSAIEPAMLKILKFKVRPDADLDELRSRFETVLQDLDGDESLDGKLGDLDEAAMNVTGQDVFGVDVWFSVPCASPNTSWDVACAARERIVKEVQDMAERSGRPVFPEAEAAEAA
ncbi:mechanosensitive ion channel [Jannaschia sp. Os4]|uniref:mechanosensitive ion channel family protein n=1 Tax=Jannaschia sp. Os4 TaxID=2807617 RepID=UPI00193A167A|nr:mechanosensitive ion channel domain-containing protein [Jannaschia sp. Os4]MBM2576865.1 mechanosensitive ion channel [Jannaschia sp. Os4]